MNAMKKTALATAVLMSMGAGAVQAATLTYDFSGFFVMFDGYDPTFSNPANVVDNGNGIAGDPATGTMSINSATGTGSGTLSGQPFFGSNWSATNLQYSITGTNTATATMMFHWGAVDVVTATDWSLPGAVDGDGTGTCGVRNCNIAVTLGLAMTPGAGDPTFGSGTTSVGDTYDMVTTASDMPTGPFAGFQPTFNGTYTVQTVPVPATAWIVGSGLLGLMGVGATRRKKRLAA